MLIPHPKSEIHNLWHQGAVTGIQCVSLEAVGSTPHLFNLLFVQFVVVAVTIIMEPHLVVLKGHFPWYLGNYEVLWGSILYAKLLFNALS